MAMALGVIDMAEFDDRDSRDFNLIRLDLYPLDDLESQAGQALVARCRDEIEATGCCSLPDFLTAEALAEMTALSQEAAASAYVAKIRTNVYFTRDDESLPEDHPKRLFMERGSAFVPADCIPAGSVQRRLYDWPPFLPFVAACLGETQLYKYADPVADTILNVVGPGEEFPWHFDTNDFSVSILTQAAEEGGRFEFAPNVRSPQDENYPGVKRVLEGARNTILSLDLNPGDLQIFKGRNSLHRVTKVGGSRPRYTAIFSYAREPGMIGRVERTRQLYGKALPVHLEAEARGARSDRLID
jgi:hypothetical protein